MALKLPGFKGLLKRELIPNIRLGTEMAKRAVFWGRVGGIFHSDELPAYGIDSSHIEEVVKSLGCGELDGFVGEVRRLSHLFERDVALGKQIHNARIEMLAGILLHHFHGFIERESNLASMFF